MAYRPSSKVLFLTICSLNKAYGGVPDYSEPEAITSILSSWLGNQLLERRETVRQRVVGEAGLEWQAISLSELEFNRNLKDGPDFGGIASATYLPAIHRYEGRFFTALGADGKKAVGESEHHVLLLSGLYGLLRPFEPIQLYSCPLKPPIDEIWKRGSLLTQVLSEYVKDHEITRIFDMTAVDVYRGLIDWEEIKAERETGVLHCYWSMGAGESALGSFGQALGSELLVRSEIELFSLGFDNKISKTMGSIVFRSSAVAGPQQPAFPEEPAPLLEINDELNGPTSEFGVRFWNLIGSRWPLFIRELQQGAPMREIVYTDRYLKSPWVFLLLRSVLLELPCREWMDLERTRLRISTERPTRRNRPPSQVDHDWQYTPAQREFTKEAMTRGVDDRRWVGTVEFCVTELKSLPHYRELAFFLDDGVRWSLKLDQGFGYWRVSSSHEFPFDDSPDDQVRAANTILNRTQVAATERHSTSVSMVRNRTTTARSGGQDLVRSR